VPVARQASFAGSTRAARGAILRELSRAPGHALPAARFSGQLGSARLAEVMSSLERDGLAHRANGSLHLGSPGPAAAAATIEA
jgi:hypothetical protein